MKKILTACAVFAFTAISFAQDVAKVNWVTFEQALELQKKAGKKAKPIFVDVYTEWCGPCKLLDKTTFIDEAVVKKLNEDYIPVKFNGEGNEVLNYKGKKYTNPNFNPDRKGRNSIHEFTTYLELVGYPSLFIFDAKGEKVKSIVGYKTAQELLKDLEAPKSVEIKKS